MKKIIIILLLLLVAVVKIGAQQRYELKCNECVFRESLTIALSQIGTREKSGNNDGEKIREYLASVGLAERNPYCVAFIYWSFLSAHKLCQTPKSHRSSIIPLPRTGSSYVLFEHARKNGKLTKYKAKVGDIIVWRNQSNYRTGHAERISELGKAGWCTTIAANVDNGVWLKKRNYLHPLSRMPLRGLIGFKID